MFRLFAWQRGDHLKLYPLRRKSRKHQNTMANGGRPAGILSKSLGMLAIVRQYTDQRVIRKELPTYSEKFARGLPIHG